VITVYSLHLLRGPEGQGAGVALMNFSSRTQAAALMQARRLWETRPLGAEADGYRLVQEDTGAVVYEYRTPG
jgi:hypothetical protein